MQHLREGGGVALAVIKRAGDDRDRAVGLEADAAHFVAGIGGNFEVLADAAAPHLAPCLALRAPRRIAVPVGGGQRLVEDRG